MKIDDYEIDIVAQGFPGNRSAMAGSAGARWCSCAHTAASR
jgi:hypothetical protein